MRLWIPVMLVACSEPDEPACAGLDEVFVYADRDADGFGGEGIGWVCAPDTDQSATGGDCDDADPRSFPGAEDLCDNVDNDCNGRPDDGVALVSWYEDADGDGSGGRAIETSCASPEPGWVTGAGDCDDADPDVSPLALEVCGDGLDQDCTGDDLRCPIWLYTVEEDDDVLVRIEVGSQRLEEVGPLGMNFVYGDLAWDPASRTLYAIAGAALPELYTVHLRTGLATLVGVHGLDGAGALTWDSSTGTLYAASLQAPQELFVLDPETAVPTRIGPIGIFIEGLGYDSTRDQLIGIGGNEGDLVTLDRTTGRATFLANDGPLGIGQVAYVPHEDAIYAVSWGRDLQRYDPRNGYRRTSVLPLPEWPPYGGLVYVSDPPD